MPSGKSRWTIGSSKSLSSLKQTSSACLILPLIRTEQGNAAGPAAEDETPL